MSDRVTKIQIGAFNQVIALTQHLINQGILNVWKTAHADGDTPRTIKRRDGSGMYQVVLNAPKIIVSPKEGNRSLVLYQITFVSGKLKLFLSTDDEDNSTIEYSLANCKFVFPVDIALAGLTPGSTKWNEIRAKMNKPGDYTIKQLLVNMATAQFSVPDEAASDFGTWSPSDFQTDKDGKQLPPPGYVAGGKRNWFAQPETIQRGFTGLIGDLARKLMDEGLNDLGYSASAVSLGSVQGHPPYFTPTDVRFQTYPWLNPSTHVQAPIGIGLPGSLNYLLYLEMTNNETPPDPNSAAAFLPVLGNWTDGTNPSSDPPSSFGTMVLGRKNFLEKYFLPKLWKVNRVMVADLTSTSPYIEQTAAAFAYKYSFSYSMSVGSGVPNVNQPQADDKDYAFAKGDSPDDKTKYLEAKLNEKYGSPPAGALTWYYTKGQDIKAHSESGIWGSKSYMDSTCWTDQRIRMHINPGTNQFVLVGAANLQLSWEVNPSRLDPNFSKTMTVYTTWKITFTLTEVSDGGLIIKIARQGPDINISGNIWSSDDGSWIKRLYNYAGNNLEYLLQGLDNSLKGQERFYFPSKGTFFIKDPMINWQGDLLASLEYNGVDNAADPNSSAERRSNLTLVPSGGFTPLDPHVANPPPSSGKVSS